MNERIKELRKVLGLNQTEFGERIGAKQTTVAGWESRGRKPSDSSVLSICREFDVNEEWLRTGEGEMFIQLSQDEELAEFLADIQRSDDSDVVKQIVLAFMKMPKEQQQGVKAVLYQFIENLHK